MQNHNIVTNWSENLRYSAKNIFFPTNVDELRMLVLQIKSGKALGSRHSFNNVADTNDTLISTEKLNKVISIDENKSLVWVESGIKYGELGIYLEKIVFKKIRCFTIYLFIFFSILYSILCRRTANL